MINIAICDDEDFWIERISTYIENFMKDKNVEITIYKYSDGEKILIENNEFDIIFLDVEMPNFNGIEIGKSIRSFDKDVLIIYVSGIIEYAPNGYLVNAFRYVLKSNLEQSLYETLQDIVQVINSNSETFSFEQDGDVIEIQLKDIIYMEVFNKIITIHMSNNKIYEFVGNLVNISEQLSTKGFLKVQKSFLVNMNYIVMMKNYQTYLSNNTSIKSSKVNWKNINETYVKWKGIK